MSNFVYNIKEKHLINGIKLIIDGEKNKIRHSFITTLTYKELRNKDYSKVVKGMLEGLENKIDILTH